MKGSKTHLPIILSGIALLWVLNCNQQIHDAIIHVDTIVAYWANGLMRQSPVIGKIFGTLNTRVGDVIVLTCFGTLFIRHAIKSSTKREAIRRLTWWGWVGFVCVATYLLTCLSEPYICRQIPLTALPDMINVQKLYGVALHTDPESSFPSGHGFAYTFFTLMALAQYTTVGVTIACIGSIMLLSRLIVGVHWLSDITLGAFPLALLMQSLMATSIAYKLRAFMQHWVIYTLLVGKKMFLGGNKTPATPSSAPIRKSDDKVPVLSARDKK